MTASWSPPSRGLTDACRQVPLRLFQGRERRHGHGDDADPGAVGTDDDGEEPSPRVLAAGDRTVRVRRPERRATRSRHRVARRPAEPARLRPLGQQQPSRVRPRREVGGGDRHRAQYVVGMDGEQLRDLRAANVRQRQRRAVAHPADRHPARPQLAGLHVGPVALESARRRRRRRHAVEQRGHRQDRRRGVGEDDRHLTGRRDRGPTGPLLPAPDLPDPPAVPRQLQRPTAADRDHARTDRQEHAMTDDAPPPGPPGPRVFVNDPVLISWVVFTFIQAVVAVLSIAEVIDETIGGIVVGVVAAAYAAVSQLFVRPATVPREPLEQLALAERQNPP